MAMEILGIEFKASYEGAQSGVNRLSKSFDEFSKKTSKVSGKVAGLAGHNKKLGQTFTNLNKDVNRSSATFGKFGSMLGRIGSMVSMYILARGIATAIEASMDMIETQNLFNVALGDMAVKTGEVVDNLSAISGLDATNLRNTIGTYALLARSMGMSSENASKLSINTNNLALDLASLTNVPIAQVMGDLRSGLLGQSETVYKYGIDVTEASIKQEALNQGISKSVRNMSQGEKMALRYAVMIRQSAIAHGDFANTIEQPANQLRILRERFSTLSRSIGSIFMPIIGALLPYLNALAILLIRVANAIAKFFGFEAPKDAVGMGGLGTSGISGLADDADGATKSLGGTSKALGDTTKKAKELAKITLGIDELNVLPEPPSDSDAGAGGAGGGGGGGIGGLGDFGGLGDMELPSYDNLMSGISQRADELAEKMAEAFGRFVKFIRPATEALGFFLNMLDTHVKPFLIGTLTDFYNEFLVPIATWTVGEGIPRFFDALSIAVQKIDWDNLRDSLKGVYTGLKDFALIHLDYLLWIFENVLVPLGTWAIGTALPKVLDLISGAFKAMNPVVEASLDVLKDIWTYVLKPLAEWTGGQILEHIEKLTDDFKEFSDWASENEGLMEVLTVLFTSLGTAIALVVGGMALWNAVAVIGTAITGAFATAVGFLTSPILITIAVIAGLIAIIVLLARNWDKVMEVAQKAWDGIKDWWKGAGEWFNSKIVKPITDFFSKLWKDVKDTANNAWLFIKGTWSVVAKWFGDLTESVKKLFNDSWNKLKEFPKVAWEYIKGVWVGVSKWFTDFVITPLSTFFTKLWNAVKDLGIGAWTGIKNIWNGVATWFSGIGTSIQTTFTGAWNSLKTGASDAWTGIKNTFSKVATFFKDVFSGAWEGVKKIFSTGGTIFKGITTGIADAFKSTVNSIIRGINTVVAVPFNAINAVLNKVRATSIAGFKPFEGFIKYNAVSVPKIPQLARGGSVAGGGLFQAGEFGKAEMIGSYGGKTTVMPLENTDFVNAIQNAVFNAVSGAFSNNSSGNGDIIIRVGELELGRASMNGMKRVARQEGRLDL